jgi:Family of unknown function (DUF5677)
MSTKRKKQHHSPAPKRSVLTGTLPSPLVTLKPLFGLLDEITGAADASLTTITTFTHETRFDVAMMVRGINILKSVRILTEAGHWEMAAAPTRQLFELVINMEWLAAMPDRTAAGLTYSEFGLLQMVRSDLANLQYAEMTGRPIDAEHKQHLESMLDSDFFDEFKTRKRADGSQMWAASWNRKTAKDMADASPHPLRAHLYRLLFSEWSEEAHATPGALIDSIFRDNKVGWEIDFMKVEAKETAQIISMAIWMFFDLVLALPLVPSLGAERLLDWTTRLRDFGIANFARNDPGATMFKRATT